MTEYDTVFASSVPFDNTRIHAAAVYCSDGRLGEQFDDFMYGALGLPRYDRLAVPGGAACLAGHFAAYREGEIVASQLEFLISVHGLRRVVLIAHQDCAFYSARLDVSPIDLVGRQHQDLAKAVERVRSMHHGLEVDAYLARIADGLIVFDRSCA